MAQNLTVEQYREARRHVQKSHVIRAWRKHVLLYVVVNIMSVIINLTVATAYTWFYFPLIFWGIGLFGFHLIFGIFLFDRTYDRQERDVQALLEQ